MKSSNKTIKSVAQKAVEQGYNNPSKGGKSPKSMSGNNKIPAIFHKMGTYKQNYTLPKS